jgi:cytochrome c biogenesis protein CcmG/thiol:disulfide interchange protein DsbE
VTSSSARTDDAPPPDLPDGSSSVPGPPPAPRRPRKVFLLVGIVLAAALGIGLFTGVGTTASSGGPPQVGSPAPAFTLPRLGGQGTVGTPSTAGGDGRPAVLLFFASWCPPCRAELPALAAAVNRERASASPLAAVPVIGIDTADPNGAAFVRSAGVTFPVASDADYSVTEHLYGLPGDPYAVAINRSGRIIHIEGGPLSVARLARWQRELLGR